MAVLDWVDPLYLAARVPDLVRAAGGQPVLSSAGGRSRETTLEELAGSDPDLIVIAPCGLDLAAAVAAGRRFRQLAMAGPVCGALASSPSTGGSGSRGQGLNWS